MEGLAHVRHLQPAAAGAGTPVQVIGCKGWEFPARAGRRAKQKPHANP
jgi:hypothetical protein